MVWSPVEGLIPYEVIESEGTYHAMSTVSPVSEWHVLCATAFVVPLCAHAPQPLALFLWEGGER